jgi:hypothetical protein
MFLGGGVGIAHGGVEADSPNNLYPVHQALPTPGRKDPKKLLASQLESTGRNEQVRVFQSG